MSGSASCRSAIRSKASASSRSAAGDQGEVIVEVRRRPASGRRRDRVLDGLRGLGRPAATAPASLARRVEQPGLPGPDGGVLEDAAAC